MESLSLKRIISLFFILLFLAISPLYTQNSLDNLEKTIDSLFKYYDEKESPGIAIGIMANDMILLSKGYGLANLEHSIKNSDSTVFNIGSVSKQFTAYAIAQLENQGKLSFDDNIRIHIPELYDFGETITIDNLLFHSSGLRGSGILRGYIEGKQEVGKVIRQEDLLNIIYNQKELNFKPGSRTMYCNSGYILLSLIVERVSKMSFSDYLKQNIFEPLHMNNTLVVNNYEKVIYNRAEPYKEDQGIFLRAEGMLWEDYGSSGIYSCIKDLFKWQKHIHNQTQMLRIDPNNSPLHAMGLMLNRTADRDIDEIFHFGSVPGYKTTLKYYPKLKLDVITLSNLDNNKDLRSIEFINSIFKNSEEKRSIARKIEIPIEHLQKLQGRYSIMGDEALISIEGKNLIANTPMGTLKLIPISQNEFFMEGTKRKIVFDGSFEFFTLKAGGGELKATRITEDKPINYVTPLNVFVGSYKSPELNIVNQIKLFENKLVIETTSNEKIYLKRVGEHMFEGINSYYYDKLVFRLIDNKAKSLRISDEAGWVQNLLFEKVN